MKTHRIIVEIDRNGRITADAEGFQGDACLKDLDRLLEGLGIEGAVVERKSDAWKTSVSRTGRTTQAVGRKG